VAIKPIVHGLEAKYYGRVQFTYLDIDDAGTAQLKSALGYRVQPHFFLLDGAGEIIKQWVGEVSEAELVQALDGALE